MSKLSYRKSIQPSISFHEIIMTKDSLSARIHLALCEINHGPVSTKKNMVVYVCGMNNVFSNSFSLILKFFGGFSELHKPY